jgi:hypothetical protein
MGTTVTYETHFTPAEQRMDTQDISIRRLLFKVGVFDSISRISQRQPHSIRAKLVDAISQRQRISCALGHFFAI